MKKILVLGILALTALTTFAQTTATATVSLNISGIQSIEVNQSNVNLTISNQLDLQNTASSVGITKSEPAHLKIVSNGGFKVFVSTLTGLMQGTEVISQDNLFISVTNPIPVVSTVTSELAGWVQVLDHNLGTQAATPIIETASVNGGTTGSTFDVEYKLANVTDIASHSTGIYSTLITYTITPL